MLKQPTDETLWIEFRKYFDAFVVDDIEKSLRAGLEVGTIILTTVGIECLSGYYAGAEADRKPFVEFMREFMPEYANYADDIYTCVRNGLAHDYVVKENTSNGRSFIFKRDHGEPHLSATPINPNMIYLSRETYAKDFLQAQQRYFAKMESNQTLWDKAMKRLKHQKGFLTVRSEDQLVPRPRGSLQSSLQPPSASAIGLSTGTSNQPPEAS